MRRKVADYVMREIEASQREEEGQIANECTPVGSVSQVTICLLHFIFFIFPPHRLKLTREHTDSRPRRPPVGPVLTRRRARGPGHVADNRGQHPTATGADPADLAHATEHRRAAHARPAAGGDAAPAAAAAARTGTEDRRCARGGAVCHWHGHDDADGDDADDEPRLYRSPDTTATAAAAATTAAATATVSATTAATARASRQRRLGLSASAGQQPAD
jgi:hypothetical protein